MVRVWMILFTFVIPTLVLLSAVALTVWFTARAAVRRELTRAGIFPAQPSSIVQAEATPGLPPVV